MDADPNILKVLIRVAAEIAYRVHCTKSYFSDVVQEEPLEEYKPLIKTISRALETIDDRLFSTMSDIKDLVSSSKDETRLCALNVLFTFLNTYSRWFVNIHELLVYLPRLNVRNESIITISSTFNDFFKDRSPSIILGSIFNALEYDFLEKVIEKLPSLKEIELDEQENIVLQLAICDRHSPSAWPVLAHELAHAIDLKNRISEQVIDEFIIARDIPHREVVESWAREISSDLIAATVLGPTPILSVLSMAYCVYPFPNNKRMRETHPDLNWRLQIISEQLRAQYGFDFLNEDLEFYKFSDTTKSMLMKKDVTGSDAVDDYENLIKPISQVIKEKVSLLELPGHELKEESIKRCVNRLMKGKPISAQGETRDSLVAGIAEYKANNFTDRKKQTAAFKDLMSKFEEIPVHISTILSSSHVARRQYIDEVVNDENLEVMTDKSVLESLCDKLANLDKLTANSIEGSWIHDSLRNRR